MNRSGKDVQWVQSFVTPDKIYCIYNAPNEDAVREHAKLGEFPADSVARVTQVIDPTTAETIRSQSPRPGSTCVSRSSRSARSSTG